MSIYEGKGYMCFTMDQVHLHGIFFRRKHAALSFLEL